MRLWAIGVRSVLVAQVIVVAGLAAANALRPAGPIGSTALLGAFLCGAIVASTRASGRAPGKFRAVATFVVATVLVLAGVELLRRRYPTAVWGSIWLPFQGMLVLGLGAATLVLGAPVAASFATARRQPVFRGISLALGLGVAIAAMVLARTFAIRLGGTGGASLIEIARLNRLGRFSGQVEGELLAILGADLEARRAFERAKTGESHTSLNMGHALPWRDFLENVAERRQLVLLMEGHHLSEHREFIRRTLPIFWRHGFRRYAAEGLCESDATFRARGYPAAATGYYARDPRFAAIVRDAVRLGFGLVAYESCCDQESREEGQARTLAAAFARAPNGRLLVHAGWGHVSKTSSDGFQRMAERLWRKTGVEPFSIWQLSSGWRPEQDEASYREALKNLGPLAEPMAIPSDGKDVDAVIVHPPVRDDRPDARPGWLHAPDRRPITGRLVGGPRPALVSAFAQNEPDSAIPLDQVLLRQGEAFELWIDAPVRLRAFSRDGALATREQIAQDVVELLVK